MNRPPSTQPIVRSLPATAEAKRSLHVKESWSEVPTPSGGVQWEKRLIGFTAYTGYEIYTGTLSLEEGKDWKAGVYDDLEDADFDRLLTSMRRIPDEDIYPVFEVGLTQFDPKATTEQDYFLKAPNVSHWDEVDTIAQSTLAEAWINQRFLDHPHPNLGTYLGCVVQEGRIVRLAFPKHVETLSNRVEKAHVPMKDLEKRETWIDGIQSAARHLHSLGYAHNDISAPNIMFKRDGVVVLIDLDSCAPIGEEVKKGGVVGGWRGPFFSKQAFKHSSVDCDEVSIQYVRDWLAGLAV